MRHPSAPNDNGSAPRTRTRGAIRTHLGRKRNGPRTRRLDDGTLVRMQEAGHVARRREEDSFDKLLGHFQSVFEQAGEKSASTFDSALDLACNALVAAGEFTMDSAERLREFLRRDVLHRDHPHLTFRTGDITTAGTLTCENCGWTIVTTRTTLLPACPQCAETSFRKTA
jgi:isocitrate dehydrogenase